MIIYSLSSLQPLKITHNEHFNHSFVIFTHELYSKRTGYIVHIHYTNDKLSVKKKKKKMVRFIGWSISSPYAGILPPTRLVYRFPAIILFHILFTPKTVMTSADRSSPLAQRSAFFTLWQILKIDYDKNEESDSCLWRVTSLPDLVRITASTLQSNGGYFFIAAIAIPRLIADTTRLSILT